ncbi:MAG TPA: endonuclease/exonuclease/phosphatase family protein [Pseudolabrys sp.]|nr:endonuclease/exonuclease/phosphatase family protein [Pseudolabrys sp.]
MPFARTIARTVVTHPALGRLRVLETLRRNRPISGGLPPLVISTLRRRTTRYVADDPHPAGEMRIASYNIHKCTGRDGHFDPRRTLAVIKELGADVVALQEVDRRFGARTGLLDLEALQHETGLVPVLAKRQRRSHGWHGNLVLVREGLTASIATLKLPGAEPRGGLVVDLDLPGQPLRIIAVHLGLLRRSRARQIDAILASAETADQRPVVLLGDFNEWRVGRRSSLRRLEPDFGPLQAHVASFPAQFPIWPLDRIIANPRQIVSHITIHDSPLARIASDHLPVTARLRVDLGVAAAGALADLSPAA